MIKINQNVRFDISGQIEFYNFKFIDYQDKDVSFNVYSLTDNAYIEENYITLFNHTFKNNESIIFQFTESQQIGLYFKYDTIDYGSIFALNDSNNKIYYQPNSLNYKDDNLTDYKYYIQAIIPLDPSADGDTLYTLADINNFLREGTSTTKHICFFDASDANAVIPIPLDTSGVYSNRKGIEYKLKQWPPGLRATSNRYDTIFVDTLGDTSLNFNILSESFFASKRYNPINSIGIFDDNLSDKLLFVLEASVYIT